MNSPFSTDVAQITTGKTLDQWYRNTTTKEAIIVKKSNNAGAGLRDKMLALFAPNVWMKKTTLAEALGVTPDAVKVQLGAALKDKEIIAHGRTASRCFALPGTPAPTAPIAEAVGAKRNNSAYKSFLTKPRTAIVHKSGADAAAASPQPAVASLMREHIILSINALRAKKDAIDIAIAALQSL